MWAATWSAGGISEIARTASSQRARRHLQTFTCDFFHPIPRGNGLSYPKNINCWKAKETRGDSISLHKTKPAKIQVASRDSNRLQAPFLQTGGPGCPARGVWVGVRLTWGPGGGGGSWGEPSRSWGFLGTLREFPGQGQRRPFPPEKVRPPLQPPAPSLGP